MPLIVHGHKHHCSEDSQVFLMSKLDFPIYVHHTILRLSEKLERCSSELKGRLDPHGWTGQGDFMEMELELILKK